MTHLYGRRHGDRIVTTCTPNGFRDLKVFRIEESRRGARIEMKIEKRILKNAIITHCACHEIEICS